ncbi:MAG: glycosyltransferase [bacterium]
MKILLVNHTFPPESLAGSELCVLNLAKELQNRGHAVAVFYRFHDPSRDEYAIRDGEYEGVPTRAVNHTFRFARNFQDIYIDTALAARFAHFLGEFRPDVVHFHHLTNLSLSLVSETKAYDCATIITLHDYWLLCQRGQLLKRDLSLCHGPTEDGCRSCLSLQLLRGNAQRVVAALLKAGSGMRRRLEGFHDLLDLSRAEIDTPDRRFVMTTSFHMGDGERETLQAHPPAAVRYPLRMAHPAVFEASIGLHPSTYAREGGGVIFEVEWNRTLLFRRLLNPKTESGHRAWHPVRIELEPNPAGGELILRTRPELENNNQFCTAGWMSPRIQEQRPESATPPRISPRIRELKNLAYQAAEIAADAVAAFSRRAEEGIHHRREWIRRIFMETDLFISPSRFLRDFYIRHGLPEEKIIFLDNGFIPPVPLPRRRIRKPLRFGYIGTWIPPKGVDIAMRAFQAIDPTQARLVVHGFFPGYEGHEEYESDLRALAGPAVEWGGKYEPGEVYSRLAELDCLIVPSIWWENSPLTVHEAFLAGVPVLTADVGGMAEQVREGGGLTFRHRDPESLRALVQRIIDTPEILNGLRAGIPVVQSLREQADILVDWYANRLAEKKSGVRVYEIQ